jgi:hypothetical protein
MLYHLCVQVCLAMLLGSDYTEGVAGIGVVNALEVVSAWPGGLEGLAGFKQWADSPDERILAAASAALQDDKGQSSSAQQQTELAGSKKSVRGKAGAKGASSRGRGGARGRGRGSGRARGRGRGRKARSASAAGDDSSSDDSSADEATDAASGDGVDAAAGVASMTEQEGSSQKESSDPQEQSQQASEQMAGDTPAQKRFKATHRGVTRSWHLPANFPSSRVHEAYLQPLVDRNPAKFLFGRPNGDLLMQFCRWVCLIATRATLGTCRIRWCWCSAANDGMERVISTHVCTWVGRTKTCSDWFCLHHQVAE